jgi:hypothetical protein
MSGGLYVSDAVWLEILQTELRWHGSNIVECQIIRNNSSVFVERIILSHNGVSTPESVIAKVTPVGCESNADADQEAGIYRVLAVYTDVLPICYWSRKINKGTCNAMLIEDLNITSEVFGPEHEWTRDELLAVIEAIAKLHSAGLHAGGQALAVDHPWLLKDPLHAVNSTWLRNMADRVLRPPFEDADPNAPGILHKIADQYDDWMQRLTSWQTVINGDIFWGNLALQSLPTGGRRVRLFDFDTAFLGLPQYDIDYLAMRGWKTTADWSEMLIHHRITLATLMPGIDFDENRWRWGYDIARLQLILQGYLLTVRILDQGEHASPEEQDWVRRSEVLFGAGFISICEKVLGTEPIL